MRVFISGGAKNGKSMYAQTVAKNMAKEKNLPLYYIATMIPADEEDRKRIARHVAERDGWGFKTIEEGYSLCDILEKSENTKESSKNNVAKVNFGGVFLLDSLTALLLNVMFGKKVTYTDSETGEVCSKVVFDEDYINEDAEKIVVDDIAEFCKSVPNIVCVSDYIYGDIQEYNEMTVEYKRKLAYCDRKVAEIFDKVIEVNYGFKEVFK